MDPKTLAVIGAGNGGFAMAADLTFAGWNINLYELPRFKENIEPLLGEKEIEITGAANNGIAKLARVTTDIREAIDDAAIIMVTTTALAHEEIANMLAPILKDDQVVFIFTGNAGSLVFYRVFEELKSKKEIQLAETITLPYACRKTSSTAVNVSRLLGKNIIAALPSKKNKEMLNIFKAIYPNTLLMSNVLEVAISNLNIILHPAPTVLNLARIENAQGDFTLYAEGFSPSMMKILDALDRELVQVKRALGLPPMSFKKQVEIRYEIPFEEWFNFIRTIGSRGPFDAESRYITEDVPIGMVLIASLGRWLQVPTPTYDAAIHIAEIINDTDYWAAGRSLENLGLSDFTVQDLQYLLNEGSVASV
jgi:opine dehydrogenase